MIKLKTLMEIFETDEKNASGFITATILRKEAIKHIKLLSTKHADDYPLLMTETERQASVNVLKFIFNITAEDLRRGLLINKEEIKQHLRDILDECRGRREMGQIEHNVFEIAEHLEINNLNFEVDT